MKAVKAKAKDAGAMATGTRFPRNAMIFRQGDPAASLYRIEAGLVTLQMLTSGGKQLILGTLGRGNFLGEGCLNGETVRIMSAKCQTRCIITPLPLEQVKAMIDEDKAFNREFMRYLISRNKRILEDLADQLLNTAERRLARQLLLLSGHNGMAVSLPQTIRRVNHQALANMIGATRSHVNTFMLLFRKRGYIDYDVRSITVRQTLYNVLIQEGESQRAGGEG